jgi:hypothetical protein
LGLVIYHLWLLSYDYMVVVFVGLWNVFVQSFFECFLVVLVNSVYSALVGYLIFNLYYLKIVFDVQQYYFVIFNNDVVHEDLTKISHPLSFNYHKFHDLIQYSYGNFKQYFDLHNVHQNVHQYFPIQYTLHYHSIKNLTFNFILHFNWYYWLVCLLKCLAFLVWFELVLIGYNFFRFYLINTGSNKFIFFLIFYSKYFN